MERQEEQVDQADREADEGLTHHAFPPRGQPILACTTVPAAIYADNVSSAQRPRYARPRSLTDGFSASRAGFAVLGVIAGLGVVIYVIVAGTSPERDVAVLAGPILLLARSVDRRYRDVGMICIASGALLSGTWQLVTDAGHGRGWPAPEVSALATAGGWIQWAAVACGAVGIVVWIRSGDLALAAMAALRPGPGVDQGIAAPCCGGGQAGRLRSAKTKAKRVEKSVA